MPSQWLSTSVLIYFFAVSPLLATTNNWNVRRENSLPSLSSKADSTSTPSTNAIQLETPKRDDRNLILSSTGRAQKAETASVSSFSSTATHLPQSALSSSKIPASTSSAGIATLSSTDNCTYLYSTFFRWFVDDDFFAVTIDDPNALPVHPRITPALSVAGAILILSGVLYTLIGIKTNWYVRVYPKIKGFG